MFSKQPFHSIVRCFFLQEYPDVAAYRDKHLGIYINLCKIFSFRVSNGNVDELLSDLQTTYNPLQFNEEGLQQPSAEVEETHQQRKRSMNSSLESNGTKIPRRGCAIDHPCSTAAEFTLEPVVGLRVQNRTYSIEDAIIAAEGISGMDENLLLEACKLFQDERKAKTFLALEGSLRKKWLLRKLRS